MKAKIIIGFIGLALIGLSCNPCKRLSKKCPPVIYDSIIEITTLDTLYLVSPADTLYLQIPIETPLEDLIVVNESPGPSVEIKIEDGILEVTAICPADSLQAIITELESREIKTIEVKVNVPVRYTSKFAKICIYGFICCIILLIGYIYIKIRYGAVSGLISRLK